MSTDHGTAHIVICADARFAPGAWITMWSASRHWKSAKPLAFHLLTKDTKAPEIIRLATLAGQAGISLQIQATDMAALQALPTLRYTAFAYLRILIPLFLPGLKNYLYLDADVLVRDSLAPLFDEPSTTAIAAVCEFGIFNLGIGLPYLSLEPEQAGIWYFNSGVLLVNAEIWREQQLTEKLLDFLHSHKTNLKHADQDAFNGILMGGVRELDWTWNFQVEAIEYLTILGWPPERTPLRARSEELLKTAKIVHFISATKPWQDYMPVPFADEYREALITSGWLTPARVLRSKMSWLLKGSRHELRKIRAGWRSKLGTSK